jgi:molybdopterin/thiamine biosynthesis adenylyltransferase
VSQEQLDADVTHARQLFEEALIRSGFTEHEGRWTGSVRHRSGITEVTITVPEDFPFRPPRTAPVDADAVPWSWHREREGSLCLVADDDYHDLWWSDAQVYLDHVAGWFDATADGWVGDRADLDLERYFYPSDDERLYLYGDLAPRLNSSVRFVPWRNRRLPQPPELMYLKDARDKPSKKSKYGRRDVYGFVADLGEVTVPPRTWEDLTSHLDTAVAQAVSSGKIDALMLTYTQAGVKGVVLLQVDIKRGGRITVRKLKSASDTPSAMAARSGPQASVLADRRVIVVGVGALGSFLADALIRAGIGHLTLADDDILLPGNLVRHLCGMDFIGIRKPEAVKQHLVFTRGIAPERIETRGAINGRSDATTLTSAYDLVINATADFSVTAILAAAARATDTTILSTAMQNEGQTFRIDVVPPLDAADELPDSARARPQGDAAYREAGCGSPISPTSPHAVIEAAAATARHAVAMLAGQPIHPAGEVRHLDAGTV